MESESSTTDAGAAQAQLASLHGGRAAMAERAVQPWWYDALAGVLVFQLLAAQSVDSPAVTVAAIVVFLVGSRVLVRAYQRVTGFWVNGLRAGRTRRVVAVWFAVYAVVLAAGLVGERVLDVRGSMAVAGAVLGVVFALTSRWWTRVFVAELREGP